MTMPFTLRRDRPTQPVQATASVLTSAHASQASTVPASADDMRPHLGWKTQMDAQTEQRNPGKVYQPLIFTPYAYDATTLLQVAIIVLICASPLKGSDPTPLYLSMLQIDGAPETATAAGGVNKVKAKRMPRVMQSHPGQLRQS